MKTTEHELIDNYLAPKIEAYFAGLYNGDPMLHLHEDLVEVIDIDNHVFKLNLDLFDEERYRAFAYNQLSICDHWSNVSYEIKEIVKIFMGEYPYIVFEDIY